MMLVGLDEHDRALVRRYRTRIGVQGRAQAENADHLVDRRGGAEPQNTTTVSSSPPTASRTIRRASSRSVVVCRPVPLDSVWVLAYADITRSRMKSSMNDKSVHWLCSRHRPVGEGRTVRRSHVLNR